MKRVGIIGANSFIARNLIQRLGNYGLADPMLYDVQTEQRDGRPNYSQVDFLSMDSVGQIDFSCDPLFLFSGKTGTLKSFEDYADFIDINEKLLLNILAAYRKKGSEAKIVFPSTRLVYKGKKSGKIAEDEEKEFKTVYAMNKYSCEQYLKMYGDVFGVNYCVFRICVPYGTMITGAQSYGTAEMFISKAEKGEALVLYGSGETRRTLTHIEDLCDALIRGALSEKCTKDIFNIGGGDDMSLSDMAALVAGHYGVDIRRVEWPEDSKKIESGDTVFDSDKFDRAVGFQYANNFRAWLEKR
jgi:UDP-glucose 4-epimerase